MARRIWSGCWPIHARARIGPMPAPIPRAAYSTPMPAAALPPTGNIALAHHGHQQQHAAGQAPAGLHQHQRGHVPVRLARTGDLRSDR